MPEITDEELHAAMARAIKQNAPHGGSRVIEYGDARVLVPTELITEALKGLQADDSLRKAAIEVANLRLPTAIKVLLSTPEGAPSALVRTVTLDIVIWFANEIIEGRASLSMN